jgi:hypothetical protein
MATNHRRTQSTVGLIGGPFYGKSWKVVWGDDQLTVTRSFAVRAQAVDFAAQVAVSAKRFDLGKTYPAHAPSCPRVLDAASVCELLDIADAALDKALARRASGLAAGQ